jgi:hypothetical protein
MKYIPLVLISFLITNGVNGQQKDTVSWAMFHTVPKHNGASSRQYHEIGDLRWKFKTGGRIFSSPAIVNELAFIGSQDGYLMRLI